MIRATFFNLGRKEKRTLDFYWWNYFAVHIRLLQEDNQKQQYRLLN
jgi:hypothetical protein